MKIKIVFVEIIERSEPATRYLIPTGKSHFGPNSSSWFNDVSTLALSNNSTQYKLLISYFYEIVLIVGGKEKDYVNANTSTLEFFQGNIGRYQERSDSQFIKERRHVEKLTKMCKSIQDVLHKQEDQDRAIKNYKQEINLMNQELQTVQTNTDIWRKKVRGDK